MVIVAPIAIVMIYLIIVIVVVVVCVPFVIVLVPLVIVLVPYVIVIMPFVVIIMPFVIVSALPVIVIAITAAQWTVVLSNILSIVLATAKTFLGHPIAILFKAGHWLKNNIYISPVRYWIG